MQDNHTRQHMRILHEGQARFRVINRYHAWRSLLEEDRDLSNGKITNICEEGVSLTSPQPLKQGDTLKMKLSKSGKPSSSTVLAEVRWTSLDLSGAGYVSGIKFLSVAEHLPKPAVKNLEKALL